MFYVGTFFALGRLPSRHGGHCNHQENGTLAGEMTTTSSNHRKAVDVSGRRWCRRTERDTLESLGGAGKCPRCTSAQRLQPRRSYVLGLESGQVEG